MRLLVALVAGLFIVLPASAQEDYPPPLAVAEDAADDHVIQVAGQSGPQSPRWQASDLRSLQVHEDAVGLTLTLEVAGFAQGEDAPLVDEVRYLMTFKVASQGYTINMYYYAEDQTATAYLRADDGFYDTVPVVVDDAGTFSIAIPHEFLFQADGRPFFPGTPVRDFSVLAAPRGDFVVQAFVRVEDRMPNEGVSETVWPLVSGVAQQGHIILSSPAPVRVSNGEATTFVFELDATNTADYKDAIRIGLEDVPDIWTVSAPDALVRLEAGETRSVPVLVTVPFNHEHGAFYDFAVTGQSQADPEARGAITLGVRYLKVPQPAGHHDTVWLHRESSRWFMNTLEDQPIPPDEDDGSGGSSSCGFSGSNGSGSSFSVELRPSLAMGIDVDLDRQAEARFLVGAGDLPTATVRVGGYFVVALQGTSSTCLSRVPEGAVIEIEQSEPFSLEANEQREIVTTIRGLPEGDYVPYVPGSQMRLIIGIFSDDGGVPIAGDMLPEPEIVPGSSFTLPLNEFHDDVRDIFETIGGVSLRAVDPQQRLVNPAETVVFRVSLDNLGTEAGDYDLRLTGLNQEWARLLGSQDVRVSGGANRTLAVAVVAPAGAADGEVADLTLHVQDRDDPNVRSLIRLVAKVDGSSDLPDESTLAARLAGELTDKESPMPWVTVLLALVAAAVARRR